MTLECQNGPLGCHLQFGVMAPTFAPLQINSIPLTIISRGISTVSLCPSFADETTTMDTATTELSTTINLAKTDIDEVTSTPVFEDMPLSSEEDYILDYIQENKKFSNVYDLVSYD